MRRPLALAALSWALACGGEEAQLDAGRPVRDAGELALPPSANAPRVSRDATAPDTFRPDSV
ncbi:MAG TPA: hypothetical protein VJ788_05785, partial [Gemmatimonadota bacterium]|nr:hypothetical protein [Gemmatimonadota bacterium]